MSTHRSLRRVGTALVASALALSLVGAGGAAQAAPAAPAARGTDWLAGQLVEAILIGHDPTFGDFADFGVTIDTALAMKAVGGRTGTLHDIRDTMEANVKSYTSFNKDRFAGPTAKLLVFTQVTGGDPTSFGGVNLVGWLNGMVTKKGPAKGRIVDHSKQDFANATGQILAVRGLTTAKSPQAAKARAFLLEQQCRQGYFRLNFAGHKAADQSCRKGSPADPDTTSYAVVQLWRISKGDHQLRAALERAVTWLAKQQRKTGAFGGGTSTTYSNANSTGLAGWALGLTGHCSAARSAARWVSGLQVGAASAGSPLEGQRGAIAYRPGALKRAEIHGITANNKDQWYRATSQAAPALQFLHGC